MKLKGDGARPMLHADGSYQKVGAIFVFNQEGGMFLTSLKQQLLQVMDELAQTIPAKEQEMVCALKDLQTKITGDLFQLAVVGQFKRGKTTLINALLGEELLPTAVVPLTSIITILEYGSDPKYVVKFLDGTKKKVAGEEIAQYNTEKGNPNNEKGVRELLISYPAPFLAQGVRLIDTPGIGSIFRHNTDVAEEFLPQVDAAIFVISGDPPLTEAEGNYLQSVKAYADKIFFAFNKIDILPEEHWQESMSFTLQGIENLLGRTNLPMFPVSSLLALQGKKEGNAEKLVESGFLRLEKALLQFVQKEKGQVLVRTTTTRVLRLLRDYLNSVQTEEKALEMMARGSADRVEQFFGYLHAIEQEQFDYTHLLGGEMKRLAQILDDWIDKNKQEFITESHHQLHNQLEQHLAFSTAQMNRHIADWFPAYLFQLFEERRPELNELAEREFIKAQTRFTNAINQQLKQIEEKASELFSFTPDLHIEAEPLQDKDRFFYKIGDQVPFMLPQISILYPFLPKKWGRKILQKKWENKLAQEIDKNWGRVRGDLVERLQESSREFAYTLHKKMSQVITRLMAAIQRAEESKEKTESEIAESREHLQKLTAQLQALQYRLEQVYQEANGT